jgi:hypothetical protein
MVVDAFQTTIPQIHKYPFKLHTRPMVSLWMLLLKMFETRKSRKGYLRAHTWQALHE